MPANFQHAPANETGYDPATVDPWIELARSQFANPGSHVLDARTLRSAQFEVLKGGYVIGAVDAALDRLDDAFAEQEANRLLIRGGHQGASEFLAGLRGTLMGRLNRGNRNHFKRVAWLQKGYSVHQVDNLLAGIRAELENPGRLTTSRLRTVSFSPRWGGYNEAQVDAFLDRTVQFLQLSRHLG